MENILIIGLDSVFFLIKLLLHFGYETQTESNKNETEQDKTKQNNH